MKTLKAKNREVDDKVGEIFETLNVSGKCRGVEWSRLAPVEQMGFEQLSAPYQGPWELLSTGSSCPCRLRGEDEPAEPRDTLCDQTSDKGDET